MCNRPVLFIDSGIGGIPYCRDFIKKNPQESICYLADHENFPYGPRKKEELTSILIKLMENYLGKIEPKIVVLACNTATIAALPSLREKFPHVLFVGTVPAVKPAAIACNNGKVGVLGTERTIEEIHSLNLADDQCEIYGIAAPELVDFIEKHFDNSCENEKQKITKKYINLFNEANVDTLVLGCTHFLFLQEEFRKEAFHSSIKVFDSLAGITKRIEYLLDKNDLRADKNCQPEYRLLLTGDTAQNTTWKIRAQSLGFKLVPISSIKEL